jgi:hypothetical protein
MQTKKFLFKLLNNLKDNNNKIKLDDIWKRYMSMPDEETYKKDTKDPLIEDRKHLEDLLRILENENLIMYAEDEQMVIIV